MNNITKEQLEQIKKYHFAILPPRLEKREEDKKETESDKIAVQCQICGRMGMMTLKEMESHSKKHEPGNIAT